MIREVTVVYLHCRSPTQITGSPGYQVYYSIMSVTPVSTETGTVVCCRGYKPVSFYSGVFQDIGCGNTTFSRHLYWGEYTAIPMIECYGKSSAAEVSWLAR